MVRPRDVLEMCHSVLFSGLWNMQTGFGQPVRTVGERRTWPRPGLRPGASVSRCAFALCAKPCCGPCRPPRPPSPAPPNAHSLGPGLARPLQGPLSTNHSDPQALSAHSHRTCRWGHIALDFFFFFCNGQNIHNVTFTTIKCTFQWFQVHSRCCTNHRHYLPIKHHLLLLSYLPTQATSHLLSVSGNLPQILKWNHTGFVL